MRRSFRVVGAAGVVLSATIALAPSASAAEKSLQGCQVQVNSPHVSGHNPDRWNVEFRVYGCTAQRTTSISRMISESVSYPDGSGGGGGDFDWQYQATVTTKAGGSSSTFYNEPCGVGQRWQVTAEGLFTINGHSTEVTQSASFTCN